MESFGARLKRLREERGLTQEEFADRLNIARSLVARFETDARMPTAMTIKQMRDILGTTCDYLLMGEV